MQRRKIDFRSADEVIQDIRHLRQQGYQRAGQWSLTQICEHLSATMNGGMDGFGFRLPWILRATVVKWAFRRGLRTRHIPGGVPALKSLVPNHSGPADDDRVIDDCIACCQRAAEFPGPMVDYPLLNDVSVDDWQDFMWIHASHHLSFLIPSGTGTE